MSAVRDDIQDAVGRRTFYAGGSSSGNGGYLRGFPMGLAGVDYTSGTGVPKNGIPGFLPGATYQNIKGSSGSVFYINTGTVTSATWVELTGGTITWNGLIPANTASAFNINDGTTNILAFDTRNTVTGVAAVTVSASPPTIATASGDTFSQLKVAAKTITLTGAATVTALEGVGLYLDIPTLTDSSAGTVTTLSNLFVAAPAAAGGSLTITNSFSAHFGSAIRIDGNINVAAQATTLSIKSATAAAFVVNDSVVNNISVNTQTTATTALGLGGITLTGEAMSFTSGAGAFNANTLVCAAKTITLTGTGTTTSLLGCGLYLDAITATDSGAGTVTTLSNMHIVANAAAGGSLTITNSYMISTSVAGCFLTNAGVWTSTSTAMHKEEIQDADADDVFGVLDQIRSRSYRWKKDFLEDYGRQRIGLIAEEVPDALRIPGHEDTTGLPDGIVAGFAVAACKALLGENRILKQRLARMEKALGIMEE